MTIGLRLSFSGEGRIFEQLRALDRRARIKALRPATQAAGKVLLAELKATAPRQSGAFRRSLMLKSKTMKNFVEVRVGQRKQRKLSKTRSSGSQITRSGIAAPIHFIERSTKPHMIRAKPGKALKFAGINKATKSGRIKRAAVVVKAVKHPGTTGQYVLARAGIRKRREARAAFINTLKSEMKSG